MQGIENSDDEYIRLYFGLIILLTRYYSNNGNYLYTFLYTYYEI